MRETINNKTNTISKDNSNSVELANQIENNAEKKSKNNNFFSKKNIILISIFFVISIAIIALAVKFLLKTNWLGLLKSIQNGFARKIGILWFSLLVLVMIWNVFATFATMMVRYKQYGIHVPLHEYILYAFTMCFLRTIIPWVVPDSYNIFWMKINNIPTHLAASITFSNSFFGELIHLLITLPAAIIIFINSKSLIYIGGQIDKQGLSILILLCVGLSLNIVSVVFWVLINMSKNVHYALSTMYNKIKKLFHIKYHTKAEIQEKYRKKAVLKQDFVNFIKNKRAFSEELIIFILIEIITYFSLAWSMYFVQEVTIDGATHIVKFDFWNIVNCANAANTANRINFLPYGAGIEWIISYSVSKLGGWLPIPGVQNPMPWYEAVTNNGIFIWRSLGIIQAIIGMFTLIGLTIIQVKQIKASSKINKVLIK